MEKQEWFAVDSTIEGHAYSESFPDYAQATAFADTLMNEWEEATGQVADRSWASSDNMYCGKCGDVGFVAVTRDHELSE